MVKIAICDDEETLILDLKEQLDRYGRRREGNSAFWSIMTAANCWLTISRIWI